MLPKKRHMFAQANKGREMFAIVGYEREQFRPDVRDCRYMFVFQNGSENRLVAQSDLDGDM